jgi:long-chain fatty acid transport protein
MVLFTVAYGGGFQLNEHGARAMGQAGAFAARASDPSAIYFNPAGLGFQKGIQTYVGATLIMPKASFFGPTELNTNEETKMVEQLFTPINVYGTYAINEDLHVGLGVYNAFGLGTEWDKDWVGKFITVKIDLQSFFFTPTIAYRFNDQLSVGVGVNYVTGSVTLSRAVPVPATTLKMELDGSSYGFNVGILYKIMPELSVGASYRSPIAFDAEGTSKFEKVYALPAGTPTPTGDVSTSITLPTTAFVGVAYKAMENLDLEFDYQFIGWSSYDELAFEFKSGYPKQVSPKKYEDTYILRLGAEYTWDAFQFRGGYLYDHNAVPTKYVEPLLPDASRNGLNLGVGYKITEQIMVDLSYLFIKFDQRKAEGTEIMFDGTYNSSANLFGFNIGYSF